MPNSGLPTDPVPKARDCVDESSQHAIEQAVREILARACAEPATSAQEVLLDFDLGHSRFVLLRFPKVSSPKPTLSPREVEIVRMVSQGLPNKVIASVLSISCWTVSTHLRRIFSKLGVTSRAAMVARMLELSSEDRPGPEEPAKPYSAIIRSA